VKLCVINKFYFKLSAQYIVSTLQYSASFHGAHKEKFQISAKPQIKEKYVIKDI